MDMLEEVPEEPSSPCIALRGVQAHTYKWYIYICSPFEVLEKGRHALHTAFTANDWETDVPSL